jgi:hypothetical protein
MLQAVSKRSAGVLPPLEGAQFGVQADESLNICL